MLTDAQYKEIMENKRTLQQRIAQVYAEGEELKVRRDELVSLKNQLEAQMSLYDNWLKDAIDEYEAAHPPEE